MRIERLVILLGTLLALVFFYLGLNKWLETKPESAPPPVVVSPTPKQPAQPPPSPEPQKQKEDQIAQKIQEEKKEEVKSKEDKNLTAKKQEPQKETEGMEKKKKEEVQEAKVTKQEKAKEKSKEETKEYVIQIGAFSSKENAEKVLKKAKAMGYKGEILSEDQFYKVRVRVKTNEPKKVVAKLRSAFGGAIIKQ